MRGGVESFIVPCETSESCGPGEASFYHPAAWQEHEASFGHGVFDHLKPDATLLGCFRRVGAGVALIDIGQFDRVAGHLLHLFSQGSDLSTITLVGGCDLQRHQVAQRVDRDVDL